MNTRFDNSGQKYNNFDIFFVCYKRTENQSKYWKGFSNKILNACRKY